MVRLAVLDSRVNMWMTEQHISSNLSALDCHSSTCIQKTNKVKKRTELKLFIM